MRANHKLLVLLPVLLLALGCGKEEGDASAVIARAGSMALTTSKFEALAGAPLDSLPASERWTIINRWIEDAVVLQEGARRGLDKRDRLTARLEEMRADLFLTELLREREEPEIADDAVADYYNSHRAEFMRTADSYLLRLYAADACSLLSSFQAKWLAGDTALPADSSVTLDRHELLDDTDISEGLRAVLAELSPGDWTEPHGTEDGCWTLLLEAVYAAGALLPLEAVSPEIEMQLKIDGSHHRREELMSDLRSRYSVTILLEDSL